MQVGMIGLGRMGATSSRWSTTVSRTASMPPTPRGGRRRPARASPRSGYSMPAAAAGALVTAGAYTIEIAATDAAGNISDAARATVAAQ
jgi:hypothetical protein